MNAGYAIHIAISGLLAAACHGRQSPRLAAVPSPLQTRRSGGRNPSLHAIFLWLVICCVLAVPRICKADGGAAEPVYRTASAILALSPDQANKGYRAEIRGVVTQPVEQGMVLHDATAGIWIYWDRTEEYSPGDKLEIRGTISSGMFAPVVNAVSIRRLGRAPLPKPEPVTFRQLSTGDLDGQYVSVVGTIRSIGIENTVPPSKRISMKVAIGADFLIATLPAENLPEVNKLTDAVVKITATAMCSKNDNRQIIAPTLAVSSMHNITVLQPPPANPFSKPLTPIGRLMQYRSGISFYDRVHVAGTVTYYLPGESIILEDHGSALYVRTTQNGDLAIGDRVEALGFPAPRAGGPILEDAILRRVSVGPPLSARPVQLADVCSGKLNYNLVSTEGHLLRRLQAPSRETLLLQDNANVLVAELDTNGSMDALNKIRDGSILRVSGISVLDVEGNWNYGIDSAKAVRCKILLRTPSDIQISGLPTWWTAGHVIYIAVGLGVLALLFLIQVVHSLVERSRLQATLAERERLAHEIHDTLAQSFAGIGFQLQAIRKAIPRELPHLQQQVELARELVRHSHKEARRSIEPLHAEPQEPANLLTSLEECAQRMVKGGAVKVVMSTEGPPRSPSPRIANALLRIGQEAIANAVRHADPMHLEISLLYKSDTLTLKVRDDGVGFVKSGNLLGFGLRGMRKRAAAISGSLEIQSHPGNGTCITAVVPLQASSTSMTMIWKSFWSYISEYVSHVPTE